MPRTTPQQRIDSAEFIIVGVVTDQLPSRWTSRSGALPAGATHAPVVAQQLDIYTDFQFKVEHVLKGSVDDESVVVRTAGGRVGDDTVVVDSAAQLREGERFVLLLTDDDPRTSNFGPVHFVTTLGYQSAYAVADGTAVMSFQGTKLYEVPLEALRERVDTSPDGVSNTPWQPLPSATVE